MDTEFFLDLEETVIDSWGSARLVNTNFMQAFLQRHGVKQVHIFSFAVWNDKDRDEFRSQIQPRLEQVLEVKILDCPTVEEMRRLDQAVTSTWFDGATDFIQVRGKQTAFTTWVNVKFPDRNCVLVDDQVLDVTVHNRRTGRNIHFVNVDNMALFHG